MTNPEPRSAVVLSVQREIASMKTRGAGEIGKQAALALAHAAKSYQGSSVEELRTELRSAATLLAAARPTAVSLRNGLNFVLAPVMDAASVDAARMMATQRATEFADRVDEAKAMIARAGASLLRNGSTYLTHCHSTAAIGIFAYAQTRGIHVRVYATETRPFRQGLLTSRALQQAGVDVRLIVDSAVLHVLETEKVAGVVIGADAVAADGSLYNKIGTRQVTLAARTLGIPVYVAAETYKFSPYTLEGEPVVIEERAASEIVDPAEVPGVTIHNPVFDRTPPEQVTAYITERGTVAPRDVRAFIEREFGGLKRWI